jgi:hypothetical protein
VSGAALLARIAEAGATAALDPDGRVRISGASRLAPALLDEARQNREALAALLAERRRAGALLAAASSAAEALATPDPEFVHERAETAAALAAEATGSCGAPMAEADHQAALAEYLAVGLQRPPGWSDVASCPPPGAWCSCCGRHHRAGGRWWREVVAPTGWRCRTCHPPVHRAPVEVVSVRTGMHPVGAPEDRP